VNTIVGVRVPVVLGLQFVALAAVMVFGWWRITRGKTVEHGTLTLRIVSAISDRIARATS
jgi:hypothetical protein